MASFFKPRKDRISKRQIPRIRFQLVNEDAGVESDPAVPPQEQPQPLYSQLWRSF